jgi:hypothetical protein
MFAGSLAGAGEVCRGLQGAGDDNFCGGELCDDDVLLERARLP